MGSWDRLSSFPLSPPQSLTHHFSTLRAPSLMDLFPALSRLHLGCASVGKSHHSLCDPWTSKFRFSLPHASTLPGAYKDNCSAALCVEDCFVVSLHPPPASSVIIPLQYIEDRLCERTTFLFRVFIMPSTTQSFSQPKFVGPAVIKKKIKASPLIHLLFLYRKLWQAGRTWVRLAFCAISLRGTEQ